MHQNDWKKGPPQRIINVKPDEVTIIAAPHAKTLKIFNSEYLPPSARRAHSNKVVTGAIFLLERTSSKVRGCFVKASGCSTACLDIKTDAMAKCSLFKPYVFICLT